MRHPALRLSQAALDATADAGGLSLPSLGVLEEDDEEGLPQLSLPSLEG